MKTENYTKAFNFVTKDICDNPKSLRYLTKIAIPGIYATLPHYNIPQNDETCQAMKDAILQYVEEELNGGIEAEWIDEEAYDFWQNLNHSSFTINEYKDRFDVIQRITKYRADLKIPDRLFV